MTDYFIKNLEIRLKSKLPGAAAQNKMAPAGRTADATARGKGQASVLILLYYNLDELWTVFIKRSKYPGYHSGQISFPGGKSEKTDKSAIYTALREAHEETGTDPDKIIVLGTLTPIHIPVSDINVLPVIGYTATLPEFNICKNEVEYLIQVPLKEVITNNMAIEKNILINSETLRVPGYLVNNEYVWGATAMILSEFIEVAACANQ